MTAPLTAQLIAALRENGVPAFPEFPHHARRIPSGCFVTIAAACADVADAVPADGGFAFPLTLHIRMRAHAPAYDDVRAFAAHALELLISALTVLQCDVRKMQCGEVRYQNTVDRLVRETEITVGGVLFCRQEVLQDANED